MGHVELNKLLKISYQFTLKRLKIAIDGWDAYTAVACLPSAGEHTATELGT